jgi:hypothetical protein
LAFVIAQATTFEAVAIVARATLPAVGLSIGLEGVPIVHDFIADITHEPLLIFLRYHAGHIRDRRLRIPRPEIAGIIRPPHLVGIG